MARFPKWLAFACTFLGGVGILSFGSVSVACWFVQDALNRKVEKVHCRINNALDRGDQVARVVVEVVERAEDELDRAKVESARHGPPPALKGMNGFLLRSALSQFPDRVRQALVAANAASEAIVIAQSAVQVVDDLPGGPVFHAHELLDFKTRLDSAAGSLQKADGLLRSADPAVAAAVPPDDVRAIDEGLENSRAVAIAVSDRLRVMQVRVAEGSQQVKTDIRRATWAVFGFSLLAVIGQCSLLVNGIRRLRSAR